MEILDTVEVRWFIDDVDGPIAAAARVWFEGVSPEAKREDRYLLTGREDLGFKARESKVEMKYLVGSLGATRLNERLTGNVERWRKLSLELADGELEKNGTWIHVAKTRRTRSFSTDHGGCNVELADIEVIKTGRQALTFALEAFGPERALLDILLRVCASAFDDAPALRLEPESSVSYPRWLPARTC